MDIPPGNCSIKLFLACTVFGGALCLAPATAFTTDHTPGLTAFASGDYPQAFRLIKANAETGDVRSQFLLSTMYRRGLGVQADEYEGFAWCKKAAEEGHLEAQFQLGLMYLDGEGVTPDETEAQNWLWEAADRGYLQASEILTYIFSDNYYTEQELGC